MLINNLLTFDRETNCWWCWATFRVFCSATVIPARKPERWTLMNLSLSDFVFVFQCYLICFSLPRYILENQTAGRDEPSSRPVLLNLHTLWVFLHIIWCKSQFFNLQFFLRFSIQPLGSQNFISIANRTYLTSRPNLTQEKKFGVVWYYILRQKFPSC